MNGRIPEDTVKLLLMHSRNKDATQRAITDIEVERARQIGVEGFTPARDAKTYPNGELVMAAECYYNDAVGIAQPMRRITRDRSVPRLWPWYARWWKPVSRERSLQKAGALCLAESDRIDRTGDQRYGQRTVLCLGATLRALSELYAGTAKEMVR